MKTANYQRKSGILAHISSLPSPYGIGDIGTSSFYPPHHMTMGEGGAVYTNNTMLMKIVNSLRDWGKDCSCPSGVDDKCGKRFKGQYGQLPYGYDHKYVFSHFGYNLKATDMQAAIGCEQIDKLSGFIQRRKENWDKLHEELSDQSEFFILPQMLEDSKPSWFGFMLTVKKNAGFTRNEIVNHIESKNIQTRMLFSGNLIKHPCFDEMRETQEGYRVVGNLENTDTIMNDSFWIGVYPGMDEEKSDYMIKTIKEFAKNKKND